MYMLHKCINVFIGFPKLLFDMIVMACHVNERNTRNRDLVKIEYHAVGDTWCQPLLSYDNCVWPM